MASDFEKPNRAYFSGRDGRKVLATPGGIVIRLWKIHCKKISSSESQPSAHLQKLTARCYSPILNPRAIICGIRQWISSSAVTAEFPANKGYVATLSHCLTMSQIAETRTTFCYLSVRLWVRVSVMIKPTLVWCGVQIVDNEFHHRCRQLSLPSATNVTEKIYEAACNAFDQGWDHAPIRCSASLRAKQPTKAMSNIIFSIRISLSGCPN